MSKFDVTYRRYRRHHRIEAGLSLRDLAAITGVSFSAIGRIERGDGAPTTDTAARLDAWLFNGTTTPKKERRPRAWHVGVEQRLARIEAHLRLEPL